jgi:hypothetical protein
MSEQHNCDHRKKKKKPHKQKQNNAQGNFQYAKAWKWNGLVKYIPNGVGISHVKANVQSYSQGILTNTNTDMNNSNTSNVLIIENRYLSGKKGTQ